MHKQSTKYQEMRLPGYPTEQEWAEIVALGAGVRMYKGKKTIFYNGEKLVGSRDENIYNHDDEERRSWKVIIVLPGVEVIPEYTFTLCWNVEIVIMADSVRRIEGRALYGCRSIKFVRLSTSLEYIGEWAFNLCIALTSIFIPPSCREIDEYAFNDCEKLIILNVPQDTRLCKGIFQRTALIKKSSIELYRTGGYRHFEEEEAVRWFKLINNGDAYALHRACTSFFPLSNIVHALVKRQGIKAMRMPNAIGITPSQYLAANTFAKISEKEIVNSYILDMIGEVF